MRGRAGRRRWGWLGGAPDLWDLLRVHRLQRRLHWRQRGQARALKDDFALVKHHQCRNQLYVVALDEVRRILHVYTGEYRRVGVLLGQLHQSWFKLPAHRTVIAVEVHDDRLPVGEYDIGEVLAGHEGCRCGKRWIRRFATLRPAQSQ